MQDRDREVFDDVRVFAREAADSAGMVPLATIQSALDFADAELGRRLLLPPESRPDGTERLSHDVRLVRALLRYRMALEGIAL